MRKLALRVGAVAALLTGCASNRNAHFDTQLAARAEMPKQVAAPSTFATKRWVIGQWASYKTITAGKTVSFEHIRVVEDDLERSCIEWIHDTEAERTKSFVCLPWKEDTRNDWEVIERIQSIVRVSSSDPTPRLWEVGNTSRVSTVRGLLGGNTYSLVLHTRQSIPRGIVEGVSVPAADFQAIRTATAEHEFWSHPEVPFGGFVKMQMHHGDWQRVLVAYGESAATADTTSHRRVIARARETCPAIAGACTMPVRSFLALAWGFGGWSEPADGERADGLFVAMQGGARLRPGLHLLGEVDMGYDGGATIEETRSAYLAGVRWTPFRRDRRATRGSMRAIDWTAFHLTASVGALQRVELRHATDTEESTWAPATRAAIGWLPFQGAHWAFGWEFRYQLARLSGEFQRDWSIVVLMQVSD